MNTDVVFGEGSEAEPVQTRLSEEDNDEEGVEDDEDCVELGRSVEEGNKKKQSTGDGGSGGDEEDELYQAMRFVLWVAAIAALAPMARKTEGYGRSDPSGRGRTLLSILSIILVGFNVIFIGFDFIAHMSSTTKPRRNMGYGELTGEFALHLSGVWFYTTGLFVHVFCLVRSRNSAEYFRFWGRISREIRGTLVQYQKLKLDLSCICAVVIVSCVGENILYHLFSMRNGRLGCITDRSITLWDFLEDYYRSNMYLRRFFNYNAVLSLLTLVSNKLTLLAVNLGDVILMVLFWVIHIRFKGFNQYLEERTSLDAPATIRPGSVSWRRVRRNYFLLIKLLDEADRIFFPLIWVSYGTNIFFICNQLYLGIRDTSVKTTAHKLYVIWSFVHLAMRTIAVNICAARIHEDAQELRFNLQSCPPSEYNDDVRRLERFLSSRVIGVTANGIFVVTRSFILMIGSAILTLEVVLLQNPAAVAAATTPLVANSSSQCHEL